MVFITINTLVGMFLLLAIEVFGCLHQQADGFFHQRVKMAWKAKGIGSPFFLVLHSFYKHKVLVALQGT
jgi:hypothetical protein